MSTKAKGHPWLLNKQVNGENFMRNPTSLKISRKKPRSRFHTKRKKIYSWVKTCENISAICISVEQWCSVMVLVCTSFLVLCLWTSPPYSNPMTDRRINVSFVSSFRRKSDMIQFILQWGELLIRPYHYVASRWEFVAPLWKKWICLK